MMGREVRLPAELVFGSIGTYQNQEVTSYGDYVDCLRERMQHAHDVARKQLDSAAHRSREIYNAKGLLNKYKPGDLAWSLLEAKQFGVMPKLEPTYDGPFLVKKNFANVDFLLQIDKSEKKDCCTMTYWMKPYQGDFPPRWLVRDRRNYCLHTRIQILCACELHCMGVYGWMKKWLRRRNVDRIKPVPQRRELRGTV